jgi:hypothetical protein
VSRAVPYQVEAARPKQREPIAEGHRAPVHAVLGSSRALGVRCIGSKEAVSEWGWGERGGPGGEGSGWAGRWVSPAVERDPAEGEAAQAAQPETRARDAVSHPLE